ncbi:MAG: topoisomerase DNA-binding C4 zinc finger domain-containing protein [Gammaproteobacteria bacterium]|nr:topoisomerase DNA-binding C4 zinc finger domain-containing protein [Gammaproteobacteria bacterium]
MREFSQHFGEGERLSLETTFRCVDRIAAIATEFILRNPAQISKTVRSIHNAEGPRVHVGLPGEQKLSLLKEALDRIVDDATQYNEPSSVLLLGRYNHLRPQNLFSLKKQYPDLQFTYKTVHGSKGLEADYVVVLGLCVAKYGFPTEIADDPLLDLVLGTPETHPNAEERRLLYVAITRARRHAYLLASGGPPSSFVTELTGDDYDTTAFGRVPERDVSCPLCIEGRLLRRENKKNDSIFYSCSNFPYCKHRQQPCPVCREGLLGRDQEKYKCRDCGQSIEACPECGAWLQTRMGRYGRFLGCTSYPSCKYTRKIKRKEPGSKDPAGRVTPRV